MTCTKSLIQYFELKTLSFRYKGQAANPMSAAYPENHMKLNFTFWTNCRLNVKTKTLCRPRATQPLEFDVPLTM